MALALPFSFLIAMGQPCRKNLYKGLHGVLRNIGAEEYYKSVQKRDNRSTSHINLYDLGSVCFLSCLIRTMKIRF